MLKKKYNSELITKVAIIGFVLVFAGIGYALLKASHAATVGDINGDGKVDVLDLSILATNFGSCGKTLSQGDLTGDGCVNISDLSVLATNWGNISSCTGTIVSSGSSIQSAINGKPTGTTFCLTGTYNITTTLVPKDGDVFMGPATLDGGNTTQFAFSGNQNGIINVRISGLLVQHFNPPAQYAALDLSPGAGWMIDHNEVAFNSTEGIEIYSGGTVSNNHVHNNGQEGIFSYASTGATIINNEVDHNNTAGFDQAIEAGGIKVSKTVNLTISGNIIHDNYGTGIWLDTNDSGYLIDNNTVTNSSHHGIKIEATASGTVSNNTVTNSGFLAPSPYGGDGINVDRSAVQAGQSVHVSSNTVKCSQGQNYNYVNGSTIIDGGGNSSAGC